MEWRGKGEERWKSKGGRDDGTELQEESYNGWLVRGAKGTIEAIQQPTQGHKRASKSECYTNEPMVQQRLERERFSHGLSQHTASRRERGRERGRERESAGCSAVKRVSETEQLMVWYISGEQEKESGQPHVDCTTLLNGKQQHRDTE